MVAPIIAPKAKQCVLRVVLGNLKIVGRYIEFLVDAVEDIGALCDLGFDCEFFLELMRRQAVTSEGMSNALSYFFHKLVVGSDTADWMAEFSFAF